MSILVGMMTRATTITATIFEERTSGRELNQGSRGISSDPLECDARAVLVPLVRPPEQITDAPDETGELSVRLGGHAMCLRTVPIISVLSDLQPVLNRLGQEFVQ
jgi:hypothetical protein